MRDQEERVWWCPPLLTNLSAFHQLLALVCRNVVLVAYVPY